MTNRSNDQTLKEAIDGMLNAFHIKNKFLEMKLIDSWEKIMGAAVANRTTEIKIRDRKLFLKLNSASLREELLNGREKIIKLLNEEAGANIIDEIILG